MAKLNVNLGDFPDSIPPIPSGKYNVRVRQVEEKPTKDGTGTNYTIQLQVVDEGEHKGRVIMHTVSTKMQGWETMLKQMFLGTKVTDMSDLSNLVDRDLVVETKVKPERTDEKTGETYPEQCVVKKIVF